MEHDPIKIGAVVGDRTRLAIYDYVAKHGAGAVSTQEVAEQFGLHPNVARMHLNKLTDVGLLAARPEKSGKGGRPGMAYSVSGNAVAFSFPPRAYDILSELLSAALDRVGPAGMVALAQVGQAFGRQVAAEGLARADINLSEATAEELLQVLTRALTERGMEATIVRHPDGTLGLAMPNCGFREVATEHPQIICRLHDSIVRGALETIIDLTGLQSIGSVLAGAAECSFVIEGKPQTQEFKAKKQLPMHS